jgi:hypothetical protein
MELILYLNTRNASLKLAVLHSLELIQHVKRKKKKKKKIQVAQGVPPSVPKSGNISHSTLYYRAHGRPSREEKAQGQQYSKFPRVKVLDIAHYRFATLTFYEKETYIS